MQAEERIMKARSSAKQEGTGTCWMRLRFSFCIRTVLIYDERGF